MGKTTKLDLERKLQEVELQSAEMALLLQGLAGLPSSTWSNTPHVEFMQAVRDGLAKRQATGSRREPVLGSKPICEFDSNVPGSFKAAMARARECGGIVRRAR